MTTKPNLQNKPVARRKKILFLKGFQLRYTFLVGGSLLVLLLFAGFHGVFMAQTVLPPDVFEGVKPAIQESTLRLFLVGLIYVGVLTMAAIFLSHRFVGPTRRVEDDIRKMAEGDKPLEPLHVREGDDFETFIQAVNQLIEKASKGKK